MPIPIENLVCWYKMNDNADSTVVVDGKGNNGTSIRNTSLMHVDGKIGNALSFNGTSDYINCNNNFLSTLQSPYSISFWIRPNTDFGTTEFAFEDIMGSAENIVNNEFRILYYNYAIYIGGDEFWEYHPSLYMAGYKGSSDALWLDFFENEIGNYVHVAMIFGTMNGNPDVYKNGVVYQRYDSGAKMPSLSYTNTNPFIIGGFWSVDAVQTSTLFDGDIDDFMIFNRALSAREVKSIYDETNPVAINDNLSAAGVNLFSMTGI